MQKYTLENKPNFINYEVVKVDMNCIDPSFNKIWEGNIVGKSTEGIIDVWLVDFDKKISPTYPFYVAAIPHTFFIDENTNKV